MLGNSYKSGIFSLSPEFYKLQLDLALGSGILVLQLESSPAKCFAKNSFINVEFSLSPESYKLKLDLTQSSVN